MDNLWNNLVKGLQEGAAAAADKAGDLTRLARARLDIAALGPNSTAPKRI